MSERRERGLLLWRLALAFGAVASTFRNPSHFAAPYDWRYFQSWIEVGRQSLVWFHQVPLWNPYGCGGEVLLANPQSLVASPTFLLPLLFGTALGIKLELVVYFFCAFDGMYRLARDYGQTRSGASLASVLFGCGGWLALHISSGHANFASAALFPYLMLAYRRGRSAPEYGIVLGGLGAWIVGLGGTSTPAMAAVLLFTLSTIDAFVERSLRPYGVLLIGAVCALLLGAARILPALEFAVDHPRRQWETDATSIVEMVRDAYWWRGVEPVPRKRYWFHEYGWRLSYVTPPLLLFALWTSLRRRASPALRTVRAMGIVVLVGAGIVAGSAWPYGPWWMLKHLPLYRDLRVPSRYAILFALACPIVCGAALDDLTARMRESRGTRLAWAVVIIAALDGLAFDYYCFRHVFEMPMVVAGPETRFYQVRGEWRTMMTHVLDNHGAIGCDEEAPLQRAAELDEGDVPQVRLLDPAAGSLHLVRLTPNRAEVEVALTRPTTLMLNQNWNEHWKASLGRVVRVGPKLARDRDGGRLGVELPAGTASVEVFYRPRSFVVGAWVSATAAPLLLVAWILRRRRRR